MPYKRHPPASEEEMNKRMRGGPTLCNLLRDIYHSTTDSEIQMQCRLAYSMGKAMLRRLEKYHSIYGIGENETTPLSEKEPIEEREMNITRWEGHHTICQTLRDMYHMTTDQKIKVECRKGMAMAKAIHERLKKHKQEEERRVTQSNPLV